MEQPLLADEHSKKKKKRIIISDIKWKSIFIEFNEKIGFGNLDQTTVFNEFNVGTKYYSIKTRYKTSNRINRQKIKEFWDCFPKNTWLSIRKNEKNIIVIDNIISEIGSLSPNELRIIQTYINDLCYIKLSTQVQMMSKSKKQEWLSLFKHYNKEIGIENLTVNTIYKENRLGEMYQNIKEYYQRLNPSKKKIIRDYWDCFPEGFLDAEIKYNSIKTNENDWLKIFKKYDKEVGLSRLRENTKFDGHKLGEKFEKIRSEYENILSENDWLKIFKKYDSEVGLFNLKKNTKFDGHKLGEKFEKIRSDYIASDNQKRSDLLLFWSCFHEAFFYEKKLLVSFKDIEWYKIFMKYNEEIGINNLTRSTVYKNYYIGNKFYYIKKVFNTLSMQEQNLVKSFWKCFPENLWSDHKANDIYWKEVFIDYNNRIGIEQIKFNTIYKNYYIGDKLNRLLQRYKESDSEKKEEMREFWHPIPFEFFINNETGNNRWISLFKEYDKEIGLEKITRTTKYKNHCLGSKYFNILKKYNISDIDTQNEMRNSWNCFDDSIWNNISEIIVTDKFWLELFNDFKVEKGFDNLINTTKYRNYRLGAKARKIKMIFNKSDDNIKIEMKSFWNCFPNYFWLN